MPGDVPRSTFPAESSGERLKRTGSRAGRPIKQFVTQHHHLPIHIPLETTCADGDEELRSLDQGLVDKSIADIKAEVSSYALSLTSLPLSFLRSTIQTKSTRSTPMQVLTWGEVQ